MSSHVRGSRLPDLRILAFEQGSLDAVFAQFVPQFGLAKVMCFRFRSVCFLFWDFRVVGRPLCRHFSHSIVGLCATGPKS